MSLAMERDRSLDGLKFILIFLVIFVHVKYINPYGTQLMKVIHSFVMPMFILLSGYFTKVTTWAHCRQWTKKILLLYLLFDSLNVLLSMWLHHKGWEYFFIGLVKPVNIMWYLLSLIWWRLILQTLSWLGLRIDWRLFVGGIVLSILVGFVPLGHELSFQRTFAWFPFFLLGYLLRQWGGIEWIRSRKAISFIPFLLIAFYLSQKLPIYMPVNGYSSMYKMVIRVLQMSNAFVICLCLLRLIPPSFASRFGWLGAHSLYFYVYHTLPIVAQRFYFEQHNIVVTPFAAFAIVVGYVLVISLMAKIRFFRLLLFQK